MSDAFNAQKLILLCILTLISCTGYSVKSSLYHSIETPKTFAVLQHSQNLAAAPRIAQRNPMATQEIEHSLIRAFSQQGYLHNPAENRPDLLIKFNTEVSTMPDVLTPQELRFRKGVSGSIFPEANPRLRSLQQRSFSLQVLSAQSGALIWNGEIQGLSPDLFSSSHALHQVTQALAEKFKEDMKR